MGKLLTEPFPEAFRGGLFPRIVLRPLLATRPKFLTASIFPVLVGTAWGIRVSGSFDGLAFTLALFATICLHAAANVFNDVGDDVGGSDRNNPDRIYPYTGGSRFIQNGVMSRNGMLGLSATLLLVALALGAALATLKGPMVIWFGLAGVSLGICYSLPVVQLSGRGVGEAAVAIAFGVLPVVGAAWLQSGILGGAAAWLAVPISLWVAAILLINEVPDRSADAAAGKRTLAVRLEVRGSQWLYAGLHVLAAVSLGMAILLGVLPIIFMIGPLLLLALALPAAQQIGMDREALTAAIRTTLVIHALGCLWLAACAIFA